MSRNQKKAEELRARTRARMETKEEPTQEAIETQEGDQEEPTQEEDQEVEPEVDYAKMKVVRARKTKERAIRIEEQMDPRVKALPNPESTALITIEALDYDPKTGEKLSHPSTVTYNEKDWIQFRNFGGAFNFSVLEIVHLPKGWWVPTVVKVKD